MDHRPFEDQLFALHDGELDGPAQRALAQHLTGCAACRTQFATWQRLAQAAFPAPSVAPSEALVQRVMARVAAAQGPRSVWRLAQWWVESRWLIPAAGLAAMLFLGIIRQPLQQTVSVDSFLTADEAAGEEDLMGLLLEDAS